MQIPLYTDFTPGPFGLKFLAAFLHVKCYKRLKKKKKGSVFCSWNFMESPQKFFWPDVWHGEESGFLFPQKGRTL